MSELNESTGSVSPLRHRVHLYVNPYTHDYEITDITTKYQVQQVSSSDAMWDHSFPTIHYREEMFFTAPVIKL